MLQDGGFRPFPEIKYNKKTDLFYDHELDMIRIVDRLPTEEEYRRVRHLILQTPPHPQPSAPAENQEESELLQDIPSPQTAITDDQVAAIIPLCPHLETVCLSGVPDTSDRTLVLLAANAINLQGLNIAGCTQVTDVGVLELTIKSLPLNWLVLSGVKGLTDPSISAIAKTCSRLMELEICDLPLITPVVVRDIWSFSRWVY
jgi:F-box and leucine-rich repeat protein GRR1